MNQERKLIGQGLEHTVLESKIPGIVLKRPRLINRLSLNYLFGGTQTVIKEFAETKSQIKGHEANVRVPAMRLFPLGKSYIIAQEYIECDKSVDIGAKLGSLGLTYQENRFRTNNKNFSCKDGVVYIIDPTCSPVRRVKKFASKTRFGPVFKYLEKHVSRYTY